MPGVTPTFIPNSLPGDIPMSEHAAENQTAVVADSATGAISFQRNTYWAPWLMAHTGRQLIIHFEPTAFWEGVTVYAEGGELLGHAPVQSKAGFFDEVEAQRHTKARRAWLEAEQARLADIREQDAQRFGGCQIIVCDDEPVRGSDDFGGQARTARVGLGEQGQEKNFDGRNARINVRDRGSLLAHFNPLSWRLLSRFRLVTDSINRFEDSPAGLVLGLVILTALAVLPLALNEGGLR